MEDNDIFQRLKLYFSQCDVLISGLQKLETWSKRLPMAATPSTAHLFIIKPSSGAWFQSLWSTHPATAERIRRLQEMR